MVVVLIQYLSFFIYTEWIRLKYGTQESVSHSYYIIKHKWLFTLVIWIMALGQCFHATISEWFFLSGVGLGFIGAATSFKSRDFTYWTHLIATIVAIVSAIIGFYSSFNETLGLFTFLIFIPLIYMTFSTRFWVWKIERYYVFVFSVLLGILYLLK